MYKKAAWKMLAKLTPGLNSLQSVLGIIVWPINIGMPFKWHLIYPQSYLIFVHISLKITLIWPLISFCWILMSTALNLNVFLNRLISQVHMCLCFWQILTNCHQNQLTREAILKTYCKLVCLHVTKQNTCDYLCQGCRTKIH